MSMKIPFSRPYFTENDVSEIITLIKQALMEGRLTSGTFVKKFEELFAQWLNIKYAVAVNSATAALHTVLLALKIKEGDEVIVPTNTFVSTAFSVLYVGAKPVFADSDEHTFNVSPDDIQNRITPKTKAIIVVHLGGNPCDMDPILEIAQEKGIFVIEDAAHGHGSQYKGKPIGTLGIAGCFSFYPSKIITTAEGGIVTTNNKELAERIKIIRNVGRASFGPSGIIQLGYNYRMSEIHAAIGLVQFKHMKEFVSKRNYLANQYTKLINKDVSWLIPQKITPNAYSSYYAYILRMSEDSPFKDNEELRKYLLSKSIESSILYHPVHMQPYFKSKFGYTDNMYPIAEMLGEKSIALPLYNGMHEQEIENVVTVLKNA